MQYTAPHHSQPGVSKMLVLRLRAIHASHMLLARRAGALPHSSGLVQDVGVPPPPPGSPAPEDAELAAEREAIVAMDARLHVRAQLHLSCLHTAPHVFAAPKPKGIRMLYALACSAMVVAGLLFGAYRLTPGYRAMPACRRAW